MYNFSPDRLKVLLSDIICGFYQSMINATCSCCVFRNFRFVRPARIAIGLSITVPGGQEYFCRIGTCAVQFSRHKSVKGLNSGAKPTGRSRNTQGNVTFRDTMYGKPEAAVNQKNASRGFDTRGKFSMGVYASALCHGSRSDVRSQMITPSDFSEMKHAERAKGSLAAVSRPRISSSTADTELEDVLRNKSICMCLWMCAYTGCPKNKRV